MGVNFDVIQVNDRVTHRQVLDELEAKRLTRIAELEALAAEEAR